MRDPISPLFCASLGALFLGESCQWLGEGSLSLFFILLSLAVSAYLFSRYRLSYAILVTAIALLLLGYYQREKSNFEMVKGSIVYPPEYTEIQGQLREYPEIGNGYFILIINTWQRRPQTGVMTFFQRLRVKVIGKDPGLNRGDQIKLACHLHPIRLYSNFAPDPMGQYYFSRRIHALGYTKSVDLIEKLSSANLFWRTLGDWRRKIRATIEENFLIHDRLSREGVFLEAIILGDRGRLENEIEETLIQSGALHLIAISGANIGMITWMMLSLLAWLGCPRTWKLLSTSVILLLFLMISGFDVSANRAVLMTLFLFTSRLCYRDASPTAAISLAGLALLIMNPAYFQDPGYILTCGLTFAIFAGIQAFSHWFPRWPLFFREFFVSCLTAAIAAFPLSLYFFQRYSLAGILAGFFLIPLSAIITGIGLLLIPIALIGSTISGWLVQAGKPVFSFFFGLASLTSHIPFTNFYRFVPTLLPAVGVLSAFALLARFRRRSTLRKPLLAALVLLLMIPLYDWRSRRRPYLEIYSLDVGQGDSQVIRFPNGDGLLIDGGGSIISDFPIGRRVILPFLLRQRIHVRWMMVTHFHADHVGGIIDLLPVLRPEETWIGSIPCQSSEWQRFLQIKPNTTKLHRICAGWNRSLHGVRFLVLHPAQATEEFRATNNQSVVLKISDRFHSFLFTGDISEAVEDEAIQRFQKELKTDVLKIAHHGSRSSSSNAFLEMVAPDWAIISVGEGNSFAFPHREVIDRLRRQGIPLLRTDRHGAVLFQSTPAEVIVKTSTIK